MNPLLCLEIAVYTFFAIGGGAGITIAQGLMYKTKVPDLKNEMVLFQKPWYLTWLMFVAFIPVYIPLWVVHCRASAKKKKEASQEMDYSSLDDTEKKERDWGWVKVSLLALCNLLMKVISNVGLKWLPPSVWQMLRGSSLIFTSILTVTYRKRKLFRFEIIGITIVVISIVILGAQAILADSSLSGAHLNPWIILLGIFLTIFSQAIESVKAILIEKFLKDSNMHSLATVAWQGFWGFLSVTLVVMPILYFIPGPDGSGYSENSIATLVEVSHSIPLIAYTVLYLVSQFFCNVYASYLITVTSALTRIVLEQFRALSVWIIDIFVYYVISKSLGEQWIVWSFMELGGFILLTFGVFIYAGAIPHPKIMGPAYMAKKEEDEKSTYQAVSANQDINAVSTDYYQNVGQLSNFDE